MKHNYLNIYNNLIKLTRNKNLYLKLEKKDTFSDRLIFLFIHLALFFRRFKTEIPKNDLQELFDFVVRQLELSIREIGYGDVTVNKKMKEFVNLFYTILNHIETTELKKQGINLSIFVNYVNIEKNLDFYDDYFTKYRNYLSKNTLNNFTKDIINFNF